MGGPRAPQAVPNRQSSLGLSPRQFAKRVGVTYYMTQFIVFGPDNQHQPSGFQRKTSIHHSSLTTTGQETIRPQAKPQGRKSEPGTRVRPSHPITVLLNRKMATQGELKMNPATVPKTCLESSTARTQAPRASPETVLTMPPHLQK